MSSPPSVVVAGAGAVGLCTALALAEAGFAVVLADGAKRGDNASGIAAGLLAPAFECAMDPIVTPHFEILMEARDLWRSLSQQAGITLDRAGAIAVGEANEVATWTTSLQNLGVRPRRLNGDEAMSLQPALRWQGPAVYAQDDWRLDANDALAALEAQAERAGVEHIASDVDDFEPGQTTLADGRIIRASWLVAATGASARLAPELKDLVPIKGQIARVAGSRMLGPVVRAPGLYIAPGSGGTLIGATMEPGQADRKVEAAVIEQLCRSARALMPGLEGAQAKGFAGVRAATPDGLPLVGPSALAGVLVAAGARRNGWLLAPLIARQIVRTLKGEAVGIPSLSASRFS